MLVRPARDIPFKQGLERLSRPRVGVDSIRDRVDGVSLEHVLGHFAVLLGNAIHVAAQVQRQDRHD